MAKMSAAQKEAVLEAHRTRKPLYVREITARVMYRNGWSYGSSNGASVTRAGLIAAGIDMDAIHAEALAEDRARTVIEEGRARAGRLTIEKAAAKLGVELPGPKPTEPLPYEPNMETIPTTDAMSEPDLRAWFELRANPKDIDTLVAEYLGKTEDEMDALHDSLHDSMA